MVRASGMGKRAPRVEVRKAANVINSDGVEVGATILNVSGGGFRLQVSEMLRIGEFISIRVDDELIPAQIRWVLGDEAGGAFLAPVDTNKL